MKKLTLTNYAQGNTTVLENEFIDRYMIKANGEYVKVYLLLLRHLNEASGMLSISEIADILECTEKDVLRALKYWKNQGLLDYCDRTEEHNAETDRSKAETSAHSAAAIMTASGTGTISDNDSAAVPNIQQYRSRKERKEFKELLFVAEQYLGKTLSAVDIDTITYFFDTLHMSAELIEYLIEYCVENGHKSMHYIQKVALSWNEQKITTVSDAKASTVMYNKNCYSVLNAYGIKGRAPAASEITYIKKWNEEYGFTLDIILEACNRTMNTIHQPNFEYTDTILKNWQSKNVHYLKDIEALDADYLRSKEQKKAQATKPDKHIKTTKFNNFDGRSYDMNDLERKLVQQ
ncbi:DnaD domain protein [Blautia obeum]|uniref:DnaD domain protein n=1 Tax=Blautia obeum TaxID=40520 RepID=UPI002A7D9E34|nr:DnaD domain protein [Lachnospiraceae bacterium]MDY2613857.1 DnaD domain protein [Lachnospiraceae bacterium]MDY4206033.1 DnaD domain protein [Lachnospiraceae bacterium]